MIRSSTRPHTLKKASNAVASVRPIYSHPPHFFIFSPARSRGLHPLGLAHDPRSRRAVLSITSIAGPTKRCSIGSPALHPAYESASAAPVRAVQPDPAVAGGPSVTLACGEVLYADLVVGADGVKSTLQKAVTGPDDRPTPTGDAAYRAVVCTDLMPQDPGSRAPSVCGDARDDRLDGAAPSPEILVISERRKSTNWCCSTLTTDL